MNFRRKTRLTLLSSGIVVLIPWMGLVLLFTSLLRPSHTTPVASPASTPLSPPSRLPSLSTRFIHGDRSLDVPVIVVTQSLSGVLQLPGPHRVYFRQVSNEVRDLGLYDFRYR